MHAYIASLIIIFFAAKVTAGMGLFMLFDGAVLERIIEARTDMLTVAMRAITALGHWMIVWLITGVVALELAARGRTIRVVALLLSVSGASLVALGLKQLLVRPRPELLAIVTESTFSFPSGHTALSLALYGILIYFLLRCACDRWLKYAGVLAGVAIIALVGFSRVYLGVHWPSDVVGGYVLTGGWVLILIAQVERLEKRKKAGK